MIHVGYDEDSDNQNNNNKMFNNMRSNGSSSGGDRFPPSGSGSTAANSNFINHNHHRTTLNLQMSPQTDPFSSHQSSAQNNQNKFYTSTPNTSSTTSNKNLSPERLFSESGENYQNQKSSTSLFNGSNSTLLPSAPKLTFSLETPPTASPRGKSPKQLGNTSAGNGSSTSNTANGHLVSATVSNFPTTSVNTSINTNTPTQSQESSTQNQNQSHSLSLSPEENFECFGDGTEAYLDSENNSLNFTRDVNDLTAGSEEVVGGLPPIRRNSWIRTSLRRSPQQNPSENNNMGRRWGSFRNASGTKRSMPVVTSSNALASQLYRSSSFHSSGRSSAGEGEEMYSDGSLEDEVIDLTQKVHHLEEKFTVLADNQNEVDDRYAKAKQENAELSTKLFMLEEQLRDVEQRSDEKIRVEQKRSKEAVARVEREKQLQIENYDYRQQVLEKDLGQAKNDASKNKDLLDRERSEKIDIRDKLHDRERELENLRDDYKQLIEESKRDREIMAIEHANSQQALIELRKEFTNLRQFQMEISPSSNHRGEMSEIIELKSILREHEEEIKELKAHNRQLQDANEELNGLILNHGLEEGRHLLTLNPLGVENSLAAEFEAMSGDQIKKALKEQKDVNEQLRSYIDGILLNIVENYPQLLEVKNKSPTKL